MHAPFYISHSVITDSTEKQLCMSLHIWSLSACVGAPTFAPGRDAVELAPGRDACAHAQVNYPRSGPVRWKWLARRVAELVVMLTVCTATQGGAVRGQGWMRG